MTNATILVVDDEQPVRNTVRAYLEKEGYTVHTAADGPTALRAARAFRPDVVILDIMLPGIDGLEVLRQIRQESSAWVIMLTARTEEMDKVLGLKMGADDYLTKPFSPRELVARVDAMLRRGSQISEGESALVFGQLRIDPAARQVWIQEQSIDLTPIEFDLLYALARHQGHVLSREQLIEQVWGYDYYGDERIVDVHIGRLRKKLVGASATADYIATARGVGYRFEAHPG
ncbi:MAG TPA: response regulator transcription factor [Caldilineae bacterium]|nr:response regulator transcription factor [Caldilineae bacterium]